MKRLPAAAIIALHLGCCQLYAQDSYSASWVVSEQWGGRTIPNPNSTLSLASLLRNSSVQKELGLSEDQKTALRTLFNDSRGSLDVSILENPPEGVDVALVAELDRAIRKQQLEKIVSEKHLERLEQIAYRIEIARAGLPAALTDGFFGEKVGIEDSQKSAIEVAAVQISEATEREIARVKEKGLKKILELLTPSQRELARKCVGNLFFLADTRPKGVNIVVDPGDLISLIQLLSIEQVVSQLKLAKSEKESLLAAVAKLKSEVRSASLAKNGGEYKNKVSIARQDAIKRLEEILDPVQVDRLRECCYQFELIKVGIVESFCSGYLGRECRVTDVQKREIREKGDGIVLQTEGEVKILWEKAFESVFQKLSNTQKRAAMIHLGGAFVFKEDSDTQMMGYLSGPKP